jgi:putative transposase
MSIQPFSTDLSDAEWRISAPLEPSTRRGRPRKHNRRTMLDPVLYVLRGGEPWRLLPHEFPPWRSVCD